MKYLVCVVALFLAVSAQAHIVDSKLGSVIAVERELTDIYAACVTKITNTTDDLTKPSRFFLCKFPIIDANEFSPTIKSFLRGEKSQKCTGEGTLEGGKVVIIFGVKDKVSTVEESKACLAKLLTGKNALKAIVHTIQ